MQEKINRLIELAKELHKLNSEYLQIKSLLQKEGCIIKDNDLSNVSIDDEPMKNRLKAEENKKLQIKKIEEDKIKKANELAEKQRKAEELAKEKG